MSFRPIAVIVLLSLLAACGSATDATTFQAPPNFTQVASVGPWVAVWTGPDKKSAIVLTAIPAKLKLEDAIQKSNVQDSDVKSEKRMTICGSQAAYFADVIGTINTKSTRAEQPNRRIEIIATLLNGKTYAAVYSRPIGALPDPAAEAAIKNICPKAAS